MNDEHDDYAVWQLVLKVESTQPVEVGTVEEVCIEWDRVLAVLVIITTQYSSRTFCLRCP